MKEPSEPHRAILCYLKALSIKPSFQSARENLSHLCTRVRALGVRVGSTFASINDPERVSAYDRAIQAVAADHDMVVDLGYASGAGLLGMLAVVHGSRAGLVLVDEGDLTTQDVILQAVGANQLDDKLRVVEGPMESLVESCSASGGPSLGVRCLLYTSPSPRDS
eukprot:TRINITY_DN28005_c0_g1_i1.p1 TRINITY_DN28005_c0_g1~~TRINITY_DN28005_c0_g1_i1.p1  ORF type:complete len:165 (-),score=34.98 TRINITY_DN28005_c0_g1_i1:51-545(-)